MTDKLKSFTPILKTCELFADIDPEQLVILLDCLGANTREFQKEELILRAGIQAKSIGIILSGRADIIQEDYWGNRSIIARIKAGDLFAESFCCAGVDQLPVSVVALEPTETLFLGFSRIISICSSACGFHNTLVKNMLMNLANKSVQLTRKLEDLSQRSTRGKLLSYLSRQAFIFGKDSFDIPFNRQELADYLAVDRSALSAELTKMRLDGLIEYRKNHFVLC